MAVPSRQCWLVGSSADERVEPGAMMAQTERAGRG
jgi:hypothetical protein